MVLRLNSTQVSLVPLLLSLLTDSRTLHGVEKAAKFASLALKRDLWDRLCVPFVEARKALLKFCLTLVNHLAENTRPVLHGEGDIDSKEIHLIPLFVESVSRCGFRRASGLVHYALISLEVIYRQSNAAYEIASLSLARTHAANIRRLLDMAERKLPVPGSSEAHRRLYRPLGLEYSTAPHRGGEATVEGEEGVNGEEPDETDGYFENGAKEKQADRDDKAHFALTPLQVSSDQEIHKFMVEIQPRSFKGGLVGDKAAAKEGARRRRRDSADEGGEGRQVSSGDDEKGKKKRENQGVVTTPSKAAKEKDEENRDQEVGKPRQMKDRVEEVKDSTEEREGGNVSDVDSKGTVSKQHYESSHCRSVYETMSQSHDLTILPERPRRRIQEDFNTATPPELRKLFCTDWQIESWCILQSPPPPQSTGQASPKTKAKPTAASSSPPPSETPFPPSPPIEKVHIIKTPPSPLQPHSPLLMPTQTKAQPPKIKVAPSQSDVSTVSLTSSSTSSPQIKAKALKADSVSKEPASVKNLKMPHLKKEAALPPKKMGLIPKSEPPSTTTLVSKKVGESKTPETGESKKKEELLVVTPKNQQSKMPKQPAKEDEASGKAKSPSEVKQAAPPIAKKISPLRAPPPKKESATSPITEKQRESDIVATPPPTEEKEEKAEASPSPSKPEEKEVAKPTVIKKLPSPKKVTSIPKPSPQIPEIDLGKADNDKHLKSSLSGLSTSVGTRRSADSLMPQSFKIGGCGLKAPSSPLFLAKKVPPLKPAIKFNRTGSSTSSSPSTRNASGTFDTFLP